MSLQPITASLQMIDGVAQPPAQVPGLYAQLAANYAARGRERDIILLHVSLAGPLDETADQLEALKQTFVHNFHLAQGSITAALRSAVYATNAYLVEQNRSLGVTRPGSLAAAVVRDDELFMAQVGEAYAYIGHSFGLEPIPAERPDDATPLGQQSGLNVRFTRNWLSNGDVLMLADPRIAHLPNQKFVTALVGQTAKTALVSLAEQLNAHSARVLIAEFNEDATRPVFATRDQIRSGPKAPQASAIIPTGMVEQPIRGRDDEARSEALYERRKMLEEQARALAANEKRLALPNPEVNEDAGIVLPEFDLTASDELLETDEPLPLFDGIRPNPAPLEKSEPPLNISELAANAAPERPKRSAALPSIEPSTTPDEDVLAALDAMDVPEQALFEEIESVTPVISAEPIRATPPPAPVRETVGSNIIEQQSRKAASGLLGSLSRFLRWIAEVLTRLRTPNVQDVDAPRGEGLYATFFAIIIPIIVTLVVSGVFMQSRERNQIAAIRSTLTTTLNEAITLESSDPAAARIRYLDVIRQADAADDRIEDNTDIVRAKQIARSAIDKLDKVVRLQARALYRYEAGTTLESIEIGVDSANQNHVYVLDTDDDWVDRHSADANLLTLVGEPERLLTRGRGVQLHIVGNITDIEWKPFASDIDEGLVAIDQSGVAIAHFPVDAKTISSPLASSNQWVNPTSLASYTGRIYVLDSDASGGQGEVWRYYPDGSNFRTDDASLTLEVGDLEGAVDVVIDPEEVSVLVLFADGRIRNYRSDRLMWDEQTVFGSGLVEPLVSPVAIKVGGFGPRSSYYILDPGSNRIVEISRTGNVLDQFRADLDDGAVDILENASDFYVTGSPRRFFFVVDNIIAVAERE